MLAHVVQMLKASKRDEILVAIGTGRDAHAFHFNPDHI